MNKLNSVNVNPVVLKVIGITASILLIAAQLAKWASKDNGAFGKFGVPTGTFVIWSLSVIALLVGTILGELHKAAFLLYSFPLLMSRSGRGFILFFISFMTCCRNKVVLGLAIPAMLIALVNIFLGGKDIAVTISMAYEGKDSTTQEKVVEMKNQPASQASQPKRDLEIEGFDQPNEI